MSINGQVWRFVSASLLFILTACTSQASLTQLPTAQVFQAPSTPTATTADVTLTSTRIDVETYIVVEGDSIQSIAATFKLEPESVLWANYDLLLDDPDFLLTGMELTILPIDGVYHQAGGTDSVQSLAAFFAADPQAIIDWPANQIDSSDPIIFLGQWVMIPGGERGLRRRFMPNLTANLMAVDPSEFGTGACPENSSAEVTGGGDYIWPVDDPTVVGDGYWSAHPGLDLTIEIGGDVYAADDGVVVFSGWSNLGYGNTVMLDHGNGDFSLYAGLSSVIATCGRAVEQGEVIASGGMTGHPAEPFVHFELRRGEDFLNPATILPN